MYQRTDMAMKTLLTMIRKEFAKSRQMMTLDELNVIRASEKLYEKLDDSNRTAFLQLARQRYQDITGEEDESTISPAWLLLLLLAYNPVTEFIYENEVARKQQRFAESMIASGNKLARIRRAMNLWKGQTEQYLVIVEDAAVLEAYRKLGVKRVRWVTQEDERTCETCGPMHNKVFKIGNIPPKPHRNCRCYVVPVDE